MTVPHEVKRLAREVDWKKIKQVWDPWAGTGVMSKVMLSEWPHLEVMNNDWNPQLKWPEALNALQPGNYRAWKQRYGVCDAMVAQRLSHQDWEQRLQQMCIQGQKGTQGLGTANTVQRRRQWKLAPMEVESYKARHRKTFSKAGDKPVEANSAPEWAPVEREKEMRLPRLADTVRLTAMMANVTQQEAFREKYPDIHEDELCLKWLNEDWRPSELYMVTINNGKELLVPKPCDRIQLVREYHERTGHWGIRRTLNLLWQRHYWVGLKQDVKAVVTQCETWQRVKTHYAREEAMLTPLEIKSFMYRWSLDLAWPTKRVTKAGNQRILIMTEHYTRFIVRVPIPKCLIDRRVTSPDSPEGNGLTERVVRTSKLCFKKMALDKGIDHEWDELLWSLVLSYNAAKQQSTGGERTLAEDLLQRAVIVKKLVIHAGCSLEVAQHRDTLLYEHRRSGSYEPKPHQFKVGDFVYIRQKPRSGMEVATKPAILKLVKVQRDGVVVLEDSTKLREKSTVQNIAPCHLQVKDPCLGTAVVVASAEVSMSIVEKMAAVE
eukprot:gene34480-biopygen31362